MFIDFSFCLAKLTLHIVDFSLCLVKLTLHTVDFSLCLVKLTLYMSTPRLASQPVSQASTVSLASQAASPPSTTSQGTTSQPTKQTANQPTSQRRTDSKHAVSHASEAIPVAMTCRVDRSGASQPAATHFLASELKASQVSTIHPSQHNPNCYWCISLGTRATCIYTPYSHGLQPCEHEVISANCSLSSLSGY